VEFKNAESRRVQICLIGSSKLNQMVHSLIPEFRDVADITIIDSIFHDALGAARRMVESDAVDIFMSAGANAQYLKDTLPKPVVVLEVRQSDVINAVLRASNISSRILLLTYKHQPTWTEFLSYFSGLEVVHKTYGTAEEARELFLGTDRSEFGVVIGSSYVCDLAEKAGLPGTLLYSKISCRAMIEEAVATAARNKVERERDAFIEFLLWQSTKALVVTDATDRAVAFNERASELMPRLKRGRGVKRFLDPRFENYTEMVAEGMVLNDRLCRVNKRLFEVDGNHVGHLYSIVASPVRPERDSDEASRSLVFQSPQMTEASHFLSVYGATPGPVLLLGETGTGKELAARQIHEVSANSKGPFVALNCAAIPSELFEAELFGYSDGAFTHARSGGKSGLLEAANNGTFFMDEINSLPLPQQAKLLRVLQEREIKPVGSRTTVALNIKFVAACNHDLYGEVQAGRFREDLYYRLNVFNVRLPALRERIEDLQPLSHHFLKKLDEQYQVDVDLEALSTLLQPYFMRFNWPGNVRQLENMLERLLVSVTLYESLADFEKALPRLVPEVFPADNTNTEPDGVASEGRLRQVEREEILKVLGQFGGNKTRTAEYLGISQTTLWRRLKAL